MVSFTEEDHRRVSAAVAAAEAGTNAEIVTVVASSSDGYGDVALCWAVVFAAVAVSAATIWPPLALWPLNPLSRGWDRVEPGTVILFTLGLWLIGFLLALALLQWPRVRLALTPEATRRRRVRARALDVFRVGTERRTVHRSGVLLYLSEAEHMAELIADESIHSQTRPNDWARAMAALVTHARDGRVADGMVASIEAIAPLLLATLPKSKDDADELPNRLIEL